MVEIKSQNVILSRFVGELSIYGDENIELLRPTCLGLAKALSESLDVSQQHTNNLEDCLSEQAKAYCRIYGRFDLYGQTIGFGRTMYRPLLHFGANETHHCDKKYPVLETNCPGLFTVQCACAHPKLICSIVMMRAELTALELYSITS